MAEEITHNDKIPFGKHKGSLMIDIPVTWLNWYLAKGNPGDIKDYVEENAEDIKEAFKINPNQSLRDFIGESSTKTRFPSIASSVPPSPQILVKTGPITQQEILDLINKRNLNIGEVIDAFIENNTLNGMDIAQYGQRLLEQCLDKSSKKKKQEKQESEREGRKETPMSWGDDLGNGVTIKLEDLPF